MLGAANAVDPFDRLVTVQQEPPVRLFACCFTRGMVCIRKVQRRPVVDRGQTPAQQHLALEVQFLRGFVTAIDAPCRHQPGELPLIQIKAGGLALFPVTGQAQPVEIGADRIDIFLAAAFSVGIVDAQHEPPAAFASQQPVVKRRADIADVKAAGRRRGEARGNSHGPRL